MCSVVRSCSGQPTSLRVTPGFEDHRMMRDGSQNGTYPNRVPAEYGGCVLVMHPLHAASTKTEHIMSRYRPIAPKPVAKSEGAADQTDTHSISSLSADNSTTKSSTGTEYRKRSRKRPPDAKSTGSGKKGRGWKNLGAMTGRSSISEGYNVEFQPPSHSLTPIFPGAVARKFGNGGFQRFQQSFDRTRSGVSVSLSLSAKSSLGELQYEQGIASNFNNALRGNGDDLRLNIGISNAEGLEKDIGIVERAETNTTPSLFSGEQSNPGLRRESSFFDGASVPTGFGAGSETRIRLFERTTTANNPSLFSAERSNAASRMNSFFGCPTLASSHVADSEACSAENAGDSRKENIVTLSLLPTTPCFVNTRSTPSNTTSSLLRSDIRWSSAKEANSSSGDLNTSLTMSSKGRWFDEEAPLSGSAAAPQSFRSFSDPPVEASQDDAGEQVVDAHYLEQRHGGSSEAVMLTDEQDGVLWVNSAFKRLSNERMSSRMQAIGPHIDPLGIRTQLATLSYQPPFPASRCKAVLWGFLKKFIMHEGGTHKPSNLLEGQFKVTSPQAKVIAPLPVSALGSTITVESIESLDPHAAPLSEDFESVLETLSTVDMPSVITDLRFRVKWINTAYKIMVGQPKCSWLASTVGGAVDHVDSPASHRLGGDVLLVCDGTQLPEGIAAFTCRVGIRWSHQGDHCATSVPSEVVRLDDETAGGLFVWGFDV